MPIKDIPQRAYTLNFNAALIKVDANSGKIIWTRTWNFGTEDAFESIIQSEDEDILATGYKDGLAEGTFLNWGKGILLKIDPPESADVELLLKGLMAELDLLFLVNP